MEIAQIVDEAFIRCFDFEEVPLRDYSDIEITRDIKEAIMSGIRIYQNTLNGK